MGAALASRRRLRAAQLPAAFRPAASELAAEAALAAGIDRALGAVGDRTEGEPVSAQLACHPGVCLLALAAGERLVALGREPHPPGVGAGVNWAVDLAADQLAALGKLALAPAAAS